MIILIALMIIAILLLVTVTADEAWLIATDTAQSVRVALNVLRGTHGRHTAHGRVTVVYGARHAAS